MTAERHMVIIETERTGKLTLTPQQFDLLLQSALVGLDAYPGPMCDDADALWNIINAAEKAHTA